LVCDRHRPCVRDLAEVLFPGLSALVVEEVEGTGGLVRLRARTTALDGICPRRGSVSRRTHAWHLRRLADLPVAGRGVVIELRVRRLSCDNAACPQRTFRQQVPALALRYARRTQRLTAKLARLAITVAGRAGAAVLAGLGVATSRSTMLRVLMALPISPGADPEGTQLTGCRPRGYSAWTTWRCGAGTATPPL
jgi:transposase